MSRKAGHIKAAASDGEQVMTQVWHGVVDTLRRLPTVGEPNPGDDQTIGDALEQLELLISLRRNQAAQGTNNAGPSTSNTNPTITLATPSTPSSSTPVPLPGGGGGTGKRRKRPSISLSPAPTPTHNIDSPLRTGSSAHTSNNNSMGPGGPTKKERSATPSTMRDREIGSGKNRPGQPFADQLPLQPGRRVAFKVPPGGGEGEAEEEGWILATIKKCLGDRLKYEVLDADDEKTSYTTTLKSIIPLPDPSTPSHLSSHPSQLENFPRHSIVLALYPDTTAFYQATVIASPIPGTGMGPNAGSGLGPGSQGSSGAASRGKADPGAKRGRYVLAFVDDGNNTHEVEARDVVMFPTT